MQIRPFELADEEAVITLWQRCDLVRPWNDPRKDIHRKLRVQPELFLVGVVDGTVVASAMAGYDGHRAWVYYFAVDPEHRERGLGRALMEHVEELMRGLGCPKINLQVRTSNTGVLEFYRRLGFAPNDVVGLGKRLESDDGWQS